MRRRVIATLIRGGGGEKNNSPRFARVGIQADHEALLKLPHQCRVSPRRHPDQSTGFDRRADEHGGCQCPDCLGVWKLVGIDKRPLQCSRRQVAGRARPKRPAAFSVKADEPVFAFVSISAAVVEAFIPQAHDCINAINGGERRECHATRRSPAATLECVNPRGQPVLSAGAGKGSNPSAWRHPTFKADRINANVVRPVRNSIKNCRKDTGHLTHRAGASIAAADVGTHLIAGRRHLGHADGEQRRDLPRRRDGDGGAILPTAECRPGTGLGQRLGHRLGRLQQGHCFTGGRRLPRGENGRITLIRQCRNRAVGGLLITYQPGGGECSKQQCHACVGFHAADVELK